MDEEGGAAETSCELANAAELPTPTTFLAECSQAPVAVDVSLRVSLDGVGYEEASKQPLICNLGLKIYGASETELKDFPAAMVAADAYAISPVLKARLAKWSAPATHGLITLELQIAVSQELLSRVVHAIYEDELHIEPKTVEPLLLLADYLQMTWLTKAVASYAKEQLLPEHGSAICNLSAAYPALGLFDDASKAVLKKQASIEPKVFVTLMSLADPDGRTQLVRNVAAEASGMWCLEYLRALREQSDIKLTARQAQLLITAHPELSASLASLREGQQAGGVETRWSREVEQHLEIVLASSSAKREPTMVWLVPLKKLPEIKDVLTSPGALFIEDGRSFKLLADSDDEESKSDGSEASVGLYVSIQDGRSWGPKDQFVITPLMCKSKAERLSIPEDMWHSATDSSWGVEELLTQWKEFTLPESPDYIPVSLRYSASK